jgi:hypothetical protein
MPPYFPGETAKVAADGRLKVPSDVLNRVSWWKKEKMRVCVELTYKGLVRVFPNSAVRKKLDADARDEPTSEADFIARAAMADRYREASLYGEPDCRLRLTKDITPWLGFSLGEEVLLYMQAFPNGLEIMTVDHRFERLIAAKAEILPWTFQAPD